MANQKIFLILKGLLLLPAWTAYLWIIFDCAVFGPLSLGAGECQDEGIRRTWLYLPFEQRYYSEVLDGASY